jgi:Putative Flp pilus-assembly TadE/G-like
MKERGAITIFVAMALLALLAFGAFVVDYGTMWVSRRQAQNAADAAAMAGARSLPINGGSYDEAASAALAFAGQSPIWGQYPTATDVTVSTAASTTALPCPPSAVATGGDCIRVDVVRGTVDRDGVAHANTLPVFFGPLVGLTSQGVRATATAQAAPGNGTPCSRPWVVADKWLKNPPPWTQDSTFNPPPGGLDSYIPPSSPGTTGFTVAANYGLQLVLKPGIIGVWSAGWTQEIDLGSATSADQISSCPSSVPVPTVGLYDPSVGPCANKGDATDPARGCINVQTAPSPTVWPAGVTALVALDPGATWNPPNGVAGSNAAMSPRIVPLLVFNTLAYYLENQPPACGGSGSGCVAQVVNIVGFFVEGMCNTGVALDPGVTCPDPGNDVVGRLMSYPAQILTGAGTVTPSASFLTVTRLVR